MNKAQTPPIKNMTHGEFRDFVISLINKHFEGQSKPGQKLAEMAGCTETTSDNWLEGRACPQLYYAVNLMAVFPEFTSAMLHLSGTTPDMDPELEMLLKSTIKRYLELKGAA